MKYIAKEIDKKRSSKFNPVLDAMASQMTKTYEQLKKYEKKAKEDRKLKNGPKRFIFPSSKTGKRLEIELNEDICSDFADEIFREIYRTKPPEM